jgi:hypothetical protein
MRELIKNEQLVTIVPQDFKNTNKGKVLNVDNSGFEMELKYKPEGLLINHICDFYSFTDNGYLYFESYIKDEVLEGVKLLGIQDIDWTDLTTNNSSLASSLGGGMYFPSIPCPEATFNDLISLQFAADVASLYNRGIYLDFEYPNKFSIKGIGNTNYDLESFVVILLVQHRSLSTISPTKMEIFESLAQADIANFLWKNLRYYDGLETVFLNINLMLSELQDEASKRDSIIDTLKDSYVSAANDQSPLIWSV